VSVAVFTSSLVISNGVAGRLSDNGVAVAVTKQLFAAEFRIILRNSLKFFHHYFLHIDDVLRI